MTGDRTLSEDLVQEAFAPLVGRLRYLRDPGAFGAYLRRTIVNLSTSHFRRDGSSARTSPQGDRILYATWDGAGGNAALWSIGVDGSDARLVVAGTWEGDWLSTGQTR